jgi:MFS family permease
VSSFGDSALYLTLGIWAKDLTGSNAAAGVVFLVMGLAHLTSPIGGLVADRVRRRPLLIAANAATGIVVLGLLFVHSAAQLWVVYVVAFGYGLGSTVITSAGPGLIKDLVREEDLAGANAAAQTIGQGLRLLSPLVGAALYASLGGASLAVLDAATFAVAIAALVSVRVAEHQSGDARPGATLTDILAGAAHLRRTPLLAQLTAASVAAMLVLGFYESVTFAVIAAIHRPAAFFGVLMSIQGAGSIVGGLASLRLIRRIGEARTLGVALAAWVIASGIYLVPALPAAVMALFIFGIAVPLFVVAVITANQRYTPPLLQGRVSAASDLVITLTQTISIAIGAALVDTVGYQPLLVVAAIVVLVPALVLVVRPAGDRSSQARGCQDGAMERVLGIGGYFMRSADPAALSSWYRDCLGLDADARGVWRQEAGDTVFAAFDADTDYFGSRSQHTMLNFRVRDLDAMLEQLRARGAVVADEPHDMAGVGRFGWVTDPDGNRIELWQPV